MIDEGHVLDSIRGEYRRYRRILELAVEQVTDDDFFPDLGNLFLNDMGDNLNANGAAPVAPYVFMSFLFEIVVEFMFLVCALDVICSSDMLVRMISLISAAVVMIYLLFIRIKSRSNLLTYSTGATAPTATPVSWTAWSMPPRSPSSTAMSARCHFGARRRTSCIT